MRYSKINIISTLQRWMDSENGQTFLNYAYSWGASIVILGTLFKLTHMPSANFWLFLGMGTEVLVFFISAFDRPFDKVTHDDNEEMPENRQKATAIAPDYGVSYPAFPDSNIQEVQDAIYNVYKQQLSKLHSQLENIDRIDDKLKIQTAYMGELNKIYQRLLDALRVKE